MTQTTVHVWLDHTYYDGLLTFAQGCYQGDGPVFWMGRELPQVAGTVQSGAVRVEDER